jgi:hypothetical protein
MTAINLRTVETVDTWLDSAVSPLYREMPLGQDWARVAKVIEEIGEAVAELILYTGQNPRKGTHPERYENLLNELADTAMSAIYAIQHFTKDREMTRRALMTAQARHLGRIT